MEYESEYHRRSHFEKPGRNVNLSLRKWTKVQAVQHLDEVEALDARQRERASQMTSATIVPSHSRSDVRRVSQ